MSIFQRKLSIIERRVIAVLIGASAAYTLLLFGLEMGLEWRFAILGPIAGFGSAIVIVFGRKAAIPLLIFSFLIQTFILYQQNQIANLAIFYQSVIQAIVFAFIAYSNATCFTRFNNAYRQSNYKECVLFFCTPGFSTLLWLGLALFFLSLPDSLEVSALLLLVFTATLGQYIGLILALRLIRVLANFDSGSNNIKIKNTLIPLWAVYACIFLFLHLLNDELEKKFSIQFEKIAVEASDLIEAQFTSQDAFIDGVGAFFSTRIFPVTQENFRGYVSHGLMRYPMIQGISWLSYLRPEELKSFTLAQQKIHPNFEIRAIGTNERLVPDGVRQFYTPVTFIEPFNANLKALGFDISSNPVRLEAIEKAISSNGVVSSAPIKLVQSQDKKMGILLLKYIPISKNGPGFVSEVLRLEDFIGLTTQRLSEDANIRVVDVDSKTVVYDSHFSQSKFTFSKAFEFGGRTFNIDTSPTPEFVSTYNPPKYKFFMGAIAAILLSLFNSFLLLISKFHRGIEEKVIEKTFQLNRSEQQLQYVLTATGDGIWDWDIKGQKVTHNHRWLELLSLHSANLDSSMEEYKEHIHPQDLDAVLESINRTLQTGVKYELEYRMIRGDKSLLWVSDKGVVVERSSSGEPLRMVGAITDISAQKQAQEKIEELAFFDTVTGLPNRRYITDRIERSIHEAARSNGFLGLMLLDLDNFKVVNDTHGHNVGDVLLRQFGSRLAGALRPMDIVARIGGDEFLVLFEKSYSSEDECRSSLEAMLERLFVEMKEPFNLGGGVKASITPSIGVVILNKHSNGFDEVLKFADLAMYKNKNNPREKFHFFDQSLHDEFLETSEMAEGLIEACNSDQIYVEYQPVLDRNKEIAAFEALSRWNHPKLGMVAPGKFISFAEKSGQISMVSNTIFKKILSSPQVAQLKTCAKPIRLMINLSGANLVDAGFADAFIAITKSYDFPLNLIDLEVTESVFLEDKQGPINTMEILRERGIKFALDDFGTGYSSFSYLQQLPIEFLKIDKTFVEGINNKNADGSIVENIIALAHTLNLKVVAEGVETEDQFNALLALGCDYFQGWYCARPGPMPLL